MTLANGVDVISQGCSGKAAALLDALGLALLRLSPPAT